MARLDTHRTPRFSRLLVLTVVAWICCATTTSAGTLFGTIGLAGEGGRFIPGHMIRIYLTTEKIRFAFAEDPQLNRLERIVRVNNAHIDFFKQYRERASQPGYLKTVAESSNAGTFVFRNIPPGRYFVLVTFPSMIAGRKVAWQVPVTLTESPYHWIHLAEENLLLPAIAR